MYYRHHGVRPLLVVRVGEAEDLGAVGHEHAAQELVHKVHLPDHVHKVQAVAQEIPTQKGIIALKGILRKIIQKISGVKEEENVKK